MRCLGAAVACSGVILLLTVAAMSAQANAAEQRQTVELEGTEALLAATRLARAAMEDGAYDRARQMLELVVDAREFDALALADRIAALFAMGQAYQGLGEHDASVRVFRGIVDDHPHLVRVRLELARSLYEVGDDGAAAHHFHHALAGELPDPVRANIRRYLHVIDHRRRWSLGVDVGVTANSNVNVAPTISQIELFGLPFELDDDARPTTGLGVTGSIAAEYRHPLTDELRLRLGGLAHQSVYRERRFNETILRGHVGVARLFDTSRLGQGELSVLAIGQRRWVGQRRYNWAAGPGVEGHVQPWDRLRFFGRAEHLFVHHDRHDDYDGQQTTVVFGPVYMLTPASYVGATLGVMRDRTDHPRLRHWSYRAGLVYRHALSYGFVVTLRPEYRQVVYDRDWPAFGARRRDHVLQGAVELHNSKVEVMGFNPTVSYRYQRRESTIELYAFEQHRVELGLTRRY